MMRTSVRRAVPTTIQDKSTASPPRAMSRESFPHHSPSMHRMGREFRCHHRWLDASWRAATSMVCLHPWRHRGGSSDRYEALRHLTSGQNRARACALSDRRRKLAGRLAFLALLNGQARNIFMVNTWFFRGKEFEICSFVLSGWMFVFDGLFRGDFFVCQRSEARHGREPRALSVSPCVRSPQPTLSRCSASNNLVSSAAGLPASRRVRGGCPKAPVRGEG